LKVTPEAADDVLMTGTNRLIVDVLHAEILAIIKHVASVSGLAW
jgi:hypothetical protein